MIIQRAAWFCISTISFDCFAGTAPTGTGGLTAAACICAIDRLFSFAMIISASTCQIQLCRLATLSELWVPALARWLLVCTPRVGVHSCCAQGRRWVARSNLELTQVATCSGAHALTFNNHASIVLFCCRLSCAFCTGSFGFSFQGDCIAVCWHTMRFFRPHRA